MLKKDRRAGSTAEHLTTSLRNRDDSLVVCQGITDQAIRTSEPKLAGLLGPYRQLKDGPTPSINYRLGKLSKLVKSTYANMSGAP